MAQNGRSMKNLFFDTTTVILAGGLGTRLRPAVADRPKVLASVHDRPFLTFLLDQIGGYGIGRVTLLTGYKADQVQHAMGDVYRDIRISYSTETAPMGTGGALRNVRPHVCTSSVLMMNGDSYCGSSLAEFARFHARRRADISMVVAEAPDCSRFGKVRLNEDGDIIRFDEKQANAGAGWINAGIYLLSTKLIDEIPTDRPVSFEREMIPHWMASGRRVAGYCCDGVFLDIGTPESYAQAEEFFAEQMLPV